MTGILFLTELAKDIPIRGKVCRMWPHVGMNKNVFLDQISAEGLFGCLNSNDRNTLQSIKKNIRLATATTIFYSGERPLQIFIHRSGWAVLWPDCSFKRAVHTAEVGSDMIYGLIEVLSGSTFDVSMTGLAESEFETRRKVTGQSKRNAWEA